jgi:hypothetical protein
MKFLETALFLFMCLTAFPVSAQIPPNFKGDFQSELRFSAGQGPVAIAIGDLNGDGRPDVVVVDYNGNGVSVLLGNGDGTFGSPTVYPTGDYPYAVTLADLNGDGHLDIVCANLNLDHLTQGGTVSVLLGKGDGTFVPAVNYVAGKNLASVVLADFNGDGKIDIATADVSSGNVAVLLNNGNGAFQPAVQYAAGPNPLSLGAGDFNGDGTMDLAVTNVCDVSQDNFNCPSQQTTVTVLLGHGDGTFGSPASYQAGPSPFNLAIHDFNSDGKSDIVVSNVSLGSGSSSNISVLLGNGDGTFQVPMSYPAGGSTLAAGDFNRDGPIDLIMGSPSGLVELLGTPSGGFYAPVRYFVPLSFSLANVAIGDLNGDGRPDIIVSGDVLEVFLNAGGTTRQATSISVTSSQNPVQALSALTITASVMPTGSPLQGSVTFYLDGQALSGGVNPLGQLNSSNEATCCPVLISSGTHSIVAIYSGDTNTQGSTSNTLMQTVVAIQTTTHLSSAPNPSLTGQNVRLIATVTGATGAVDGSVTFFDGATALGTVPLVSNQPGPVTVGLDVSNLTAGTHALTAAFGRSAYSAPSVSPVLQQVVNGNLNLSIAAGSQGAATVSAGKTAEYGLTVGGAGFSGQTTVSCSGVPTGATCSVMPASLMVSATNASPVTVSVTTMTRSSSLLRPQGSRSSWLWAVMLLGFVFALPRARNCGKLERKLVMVWLFLVALGSASCGGSNSGSNTNFNGTPAGTYNITVAATSGSITNSVSLMLTVQ